MERSKKGGGRGQARKRKGQGKEEDMSRKRRGKEEKGGGHKEVMRRK